MIERYSDVIYGEPTATPVPTAPPTVTPGASPSPTLSGRQLTFSDLPPSNPFYQYVRCLLCRGIISGYTDSTFRPANNVIRGHLAKMVSNSARYTDTIPAGQQTFSDVPPSDGFWIFVERAYLHGDLDGYDTAQGCDSAATPCYKLYRAMTRAQLAKVVANAAGYVEQLTTVTFQDVPASHPFYD